MARKQTTNETPVEAAQRVLAELQAKHDKVAAARESDDREMGAISYSAHTGDVKAATALIDIRERAIRRDHELTSIRSAIAIAQQGSVASGLLSRKCSALVHVGGFAAE